MLSKQQWRGTLLLHPTYATMTLLAFILWSAVLIATAIQDYKTYLIPDWLNALAATASLLLAYSLEHSIEFVTYGTIAGLALPTLINWISLKSKLRTKAIGNGDVKFLVAVGSVLGATGVWFALLIACATAAAMNKKSTYIPFGPALVAGCFCTLAGHHFNLL